jgi:uncharacterized membrane protein
LADDKKLQRQRPGEAPPQSVQIPIRQQSLEIHRGPLPSPGVLADYDRVHPGLAERIVRLAEDEAKHRRSMESASLDGDMTYMRGCLSAERRGQYLAGIIAVSLAGIGGYVAMQGHDATGAAIGVTGVASIVTALIVGCGKKEPEANKIEVAKKAPAAQTPPPPTVR